MYLLRLARWCSVLLLSVLTSCLLAGPEQSVVKVALFRGVMMKQTGSGFAVSESRILTARHVVNGRGTVRVQTQGGGWRNATVIADGGRYADYAILQTRPHGVPALPASRVTTGSVSVYGWPDSRVVTNSGQISSWAFQGRNGFATVKVWPGWSGGPIVASDGGYVGVVSMQTPTGNCLYVRAEDIR